MSVDSSLRVPAFAQRDSIPVLSRQPAAERCVGGSPEFVVSIVADAACSAKLV